MLNTLGGEMMYTISTRSPLTRIVMRSHQEASSLAKTSTTGQVLFCVTVLWLRNIYFGEHLTPLKRSTEPMTCTYLIFYFWSQFSQYQSYTMMISHLIFLKFSTLWGLRIPFSTTMIWCTKCYPVSQRFNEFSIYLTHRENCAEVPVWFYDMYVCSLIFACIFLYFHFYL